MTGGRSLRLAPEEAALSGTLTASFEARVQELQPALEGRGVRRPLDLGGDERDNVCSHSRDPKRSGLDARGNGNLFRGNVVSVNAGAGIRFGGYGTYDGVENSAVDNVLVADRGYGLLVLRRPQARICGNVVRQSGRGSANVKGLRPSRPC